MRNYKIEGTITYTASEESEDGTCDLDIDTKIEVADDENAMDALRTFLDSMPDIYYAGSLTQFDAETRGGQWAEFIEQSDSGIKRVLVSALRQVLKNGVKIVSDYKYDKKEIAIFNLFI